MVKPNMEHIALLNTRVRRAPASLAGYHYYLEAGKKVYVTYKDEQRKRATVSTVEWDHRCSEDLFTVPFSFLNEMPTNIVKPNMNTNKCRRCGKHYMSGKQLEAHINKVHADDKVNREGGNTWIRSEVTRISAGNREMTIVKPNLNQRKNNKMNTEELHLSRMPEYLPAGVRQEAAELLAQIDKVTAQCDELLAALKWCRQCSLAWWNSVDNNARKPLEAISGHAQAAIAKADSFAKASQSKEGSVQ